MQPVSGSPSNHGSGWIQGTAAIYLPRFHLPAGHFQIEALIT